MCQTFHLAFSVCNCIWVSQNSCQEIVLFLFCTIGGPERSKRLAHSYKASKWRGSGLEAFDPKAIISPCLQVHKCYTVPLWSFIYKIPSYKPIKCFLIHNIENSSTLENLSHNCFSVIAHNIVTLIDLRSICFPLENNDSPNRCQSKRWCCFFIAHYDLILHLHDWWGSIPVVRVNRYYDPERLVEKSPQPLKCVYVKGTEVVETSIREINIQWQEHDKGRPSQFILF